MYSTTNISRMKPFGVFTIIILSFTIITIFHLDVSKADNYGKGFFNHSGCLYAYNQGGLFEMITADGEVISEKLDTEEITFDSRNSRCMEKNAPGKLVFSFKLDEKNKLKSVTISMRVVQSIEYWEISQANLTVTRADMNRKRTFQLDLQDDIYAGLDYSWSCSELLLQTLHKKSDNETGKIEPRAILTLNRFQLQPFPEPSKSVFADSFDCSVYFTIPGLMGLFVALFVTTLTIVGVCLLGNIETNDFKFSKESQQFTQTQMESNKVR